jgi:hypothetical protein
MVELKAREPIGILVMTRMFFVDADGRPFIEASPAQRKGFPMITGIAASDFEDNAEAAQQRVRRALGVARHYQTTAMAEHLKLGSVAIGDGGRINLMLGRTRVGLGSTRFELKLERLNQIFDSLKKRKVGAEYILFGDDPSRVIVKESVLASADGTSFSLNSAGAKK